MVVRRVVPVSAAAAVLRLPFQRGQRSNSGAEEQSWAMRGRSSPPHHHSSGYPGNLLKKTHKTTKTVNMVIITTKVNR